MDAPGQEQLLCLDAADVGMKPPAEGQRDVSYVSSSPWGRCHPPARGAGTVPPPTSSPWQLPPKKPPTRVSQGRKPQISTRRDLFALPSSSSEHEPRKLSAAPLYRKPPDGF